MRQQIVKAVGGTVSVDFPRAVDSSPAPTVTITRSDGGAVDGTPVVDSLATASTLSHTFDPNGDAGTLEPETRHLTPLSVNTLATVPAKGTVVDIYSQARKQHQVTQVLSANLAGASLLRRTEITTRDLLQFPLEKDDTIKGVSVSYTLSAVQVPRIEQSYRAVFKANIDGVTYRRETVFDVGLRESYNPASVLSLKAAWPNLADSESDEWEDLHGQPAIDIAWQQVSDALLARGRNPNRCREPDTLQPMIVNRALRHLAMFGHVPSIWLEDIKGWLSQLDDDFKGLLDTGVTGVNQWYDDEDDGTQQATETVSKERFIRLTR